MKAMKQTDFWDLTFFHHVRLGAVYHAFLREVLPELLQNMDLQTGILLRSMHDGAAPYLISWFSGILEPPVAGTTDRTWWTNSKACSFSGFTTLNIFISGHICSLLFKLQKSVTSRTFNNWHRMDSGWFARYLEFSNESGNRCWDMQRPALKLKVDTSSIFFNLQEAVTRRPRFRTPKFIKHFLLYCGLTFPFAVLSVQFSYPLYNVDIEGTISFSFQRNSITC